MAPPFSMHLTFFRCTSEDVRTVISNRLLPPNTLSGAAVLFAIALLCAGQSAAITATLSGQIVSEGFIAWRMSVGVLC
jgi:NRAMP (natural resistance-associated macrophage protein)-like metal ion transporter